MIYAIGDIHGRFALLKELYTKILSDIDSCADDKNTIVFLGDYIDRGNENVQVLDFIRYLEDTDKIEHIFIRGNHEEIFKNAMEKPRDRFSVGMWIQNGGQQFLEEVGMDFIYFNEVFPWYIYVNWMNRKLVNYHETEDYIFVHGGLDVRKQRMRDQESQLLYWARFTDKDWYASYHKMVIHGHTPNLEPQFDKNRVNVDTSIYQMHGPRVLRLTAVALPNSRNDEKSPPRFIQVEEQV